jgi:hypothetical protein
MLSKDNLGKDERAERRDIEKRECKRGEIK